jgi:hypothetical protein
MKIVYNEIVEDHTAKIFSIFKEYIFNYLKSYERNKSITTSGFQSFLDKYYPRQGELLRSSNVNKGKLTKLIKALNRSGLVDCMLPR